MPGGAGGGICRRGATLVTKGTAHTTGTSTPAQARELAPREMPARTDANIDDVGWWHTCKQTAMEWIKCRIEDRHNGYRPPMAQAVTVEAVAAYFA
eukprot:scaffold12605_cov114-Isochrysis_galbana.AAC.12